MEPEDKRIPDIYGPGTYTDRTFIPVPRDTERIFRLLASQTPGFTQDEALLSKVKFVGEDYPVLPGPIKSVPVAAALHAMAGVVGDEILALRGLKNPERQIVVNTTHAAFFLATAALVYLDHESLASLGQQKKLKPLLPDWERGWHSTPLKLRGTGIYPTSVPGTWYSLHGSLDVPPMLRTLGIDPDDPTIDTNDKAAALIANTTSKLTPAELELHNLLHGFCGSICFTPRNGPRAKWAAHSPPTPSSTAPHLRDIDTLQLTLNAGKRTTALDLRDPPDRAHLSALLASADVVIQGFRPGRLGGASLGALLDVNSLLLRAADRGRGVVYVSESCYGPDGYYAERPGWQQIADCASGAAHVMGRALGLDGGECVLPALPISDMTTGVVAGIGCMLALRERAEKGGSYVVHAALVAANCYALAEEVGLYGREVVRECQGRFGWAEMRGAHHVLDLMRTVWRGWTGTGTEGGEVLGGYLREESGWFQSWEGSAFGGRRLSILRPVVRFVVAGGGGGGGGGGEGERVDVSTPEWRSPSVPHGWERKELVSFESTAATGTVMERMMQGRFPSVLFWRYRWREHVVGLLSWIGRMPKRWFSSK
ncbi:CoA-transferase family III domain-containing protein [Bombardia bombarda]|uniref:CoA-transferase family III domain-containing protein n=1 Tax=Bombardia bombarda TaxID=252184 RepID=A0AA39T0T8_9PEZI|nr:CoA-transferase family III domain-containing protein [Bombardia bombarda]